MPAQIWQISTLVFYWLCMFQPVPEWCSCYVEGKSGCHPKEGNTDASTETAMEGEREREIEKTTQPFLAGKSTTCRSFTYVYLCDFWTWLGSGHVPSNHVWWPEGIPLNGFFSLGCTCRCPPVMLCIEPWAWWFRLLRAIRYIWEGLDLLHQSYKWIIDYWLCACFGLWIIMSQSGFWKMTSHHFHHVSALYPYRCTD